MHENKSFTINNSDRQQISNKNNSNSNIENNSNSMSKGGSKASFQSTESCKII